MDTTYNNKNLSDEYEFEKQQCLDKLNLYQCDVAIIWLKQKLKELGNDIKDERAFKADIIEQIKSSWRNIETAAVLCTCETLFNKKHGKKSLKDIFEKHNIDIKGSIFSITIKQNGVTVADGHGIRRKVFYNSVEEKIYYDLIKKS